MSRISFKESTLPNSVSANRWNIGIQSDGNLYRRGHTGDAILIGGGGSQTLEQTLSLGNNTGANSIVVNNNRFIAAEPSSEGAISRIRFNEGTITLNAELNDLSSPEYGSSEIVMSSTSLLVGQIGTGSVGTFKGIEYKKDFSANFTNRSLVDKEYVDRTNLTVDIAQSGAQSGSFLTATVTGGTSPYTYSWEIAGAPPSHTFSGGSTDTITGITGIPGTGLSTEHSGFIIYLSLFKVRVTDDRGFTQDAYYNYRNTLNYE